MCNSMVMMLTKKHACRVTPCTFSTSSSAAETPSVAAAVAASGVAEVSHHIRRY